MGNLFGSVTLEDVVARGDKDELADFARERLGLVIDLEKPFDALVAQVQAAAQEAEKPVPPKPRRASRNPTINAAPDRYLLNPETGLFWPRTDLLAARGDLVPCDEEGNAL